ncbi:MAG: DUF4105 domain-containing protein [Bacteroidaceae bacterium]|nr:DUF4105 domain-containing protein [Bacteroidaceae bacterium]
MFRLLTILLLCLSITVRAQESESDSVESSFPTDVYAYYMLISPGETVSSALGHAAIRMACPSAGLDYCFTIKTPEFKDELFDVLFGRLRMGLVPEETSMFYDDYMKQGRDVVAYRLGLTIDEARNLWKALDNQVARGLCWEVNYVNNGCTQVCFENLFEILDARMGNRTDSLIRAVVPFQTRRQAVEKTLGHSSWLGFFLHSCYAGPLDEPVSPRQIVAMPEDGAALLQAAGLLVEKEGFVKDRKPETSSAWDATWFTPLMASVLFLLICCMPFRQIDYVVFPLQVVLWLFFLALSFFAHSAGIGFNWLTIALFPLTAPVGIIYMLCHMGDIYSLSQLLFVVGFFIRTLYLIKRKRLLTNILTFKTKSK